MSLVCFLASVIVVCNEKTKSYTLREVEHRFSGKLTFNHTIDMLLKIKLLYMEIQCLNLCVIKLIMFNTVIRVESIIECHFTLLL